MLRAAREPLKSRPEAPRTEAQPQNLIFRFLREASSDMLTFGGAVGCPGVLQATLGEEGAEAAPQMGTQK